MNYLLLRRNPKKTDTYYFFNVIQEVWVDDQKGYHHATEHYGGRGMEIAISIWNLDEQTNIDGSRYFTLEMEDDMFREVMIFMQQADVTKTYKCDKYHFKFTVRPVEINRHFEDPKLKEMYRIPYEDVFRYGLKSKR